MKKTYNAPECEIVELDKEDIIATSSYSGGDIDAGSTDIDLPDLDITI